jgi:hypothetical protein
MAEYRLERGEVSGRLQEHGCEPVAQIMAAVLKADPLGESPEMS